MYYTLLLHEVLIDFYIVPREFFANRMLTVW